jgi:hypothetical protein
MRRRLLSIAFFVCLVASVSLMAMWVRSYGHNDRASGHFGTGHGFQIASNYGRVVLYIGNSGLGSYFTTAVVSPGPSRRLSANLQALNGPHYTGVPNPQLALSNFGFDGYVNGTGRFLILPYWFLMLGAGSLAIICRLRWPPRFTLRSLFIATTLLAVVMGISVWLDRGWIGIWI